jgi:hypothetical protein
MDEEQERSANLLFLDEGVTDASLDALLATGAKALPGCVSRKGAWTCRGAPFSAKSTAARFTMGLRGCHLQSS